jgi:hypothetical protein
VKKVLINAVGQRHKKLVVISRADNSKKNQARWLCACDCGGQTIAIGTHLRSGHTTSCGCTSDAKISALNKAHGYSKSPIYNVWKEMRARCNRKTHARFDDYGGRGITVCDSWNQSFEKFFADVGQGYSPGLQLDRIDNDKGYNPQNTRWVTNKINARNSRHTKITNQDAGAIKTMLAMGAKHKEIALAFEVNKSIVSSISCGKSWGDVSALIAV